MVFWVQGDVNDLTFYIVQDSDSDTHAGYTFDEATSGSQSLYANIPWSDGNLYWRADENPAGYLDAAWGGTVDKDHLWTLGASNGASDEQYINRDGEQIAYSTGTLPQITGDGSKFQLGSDTDSVDGQITEVIAYKTSHNSSQRAQVESYLGIKYGLTLNNGASDYVDAASNKVWDHTTNTGFGNDIAGIGSDEASGLEQTQSQSVNADSVVQISNASSQDEGDFLVWGNDNDDNGTIETTTSELDTASYTNRLDREWRVQETNDIGTVDVTVAAPGVVGDVYIPY